MGQLTFRPQQSASILPTNLIMANIGDSLKNFWTQPCLALIAALLGGIGSLGVANAACRRRI